MRRVLIPAVFLAVLVAGSLHSATVMVHIHGDVDVDRDNDDIQRLVTAVEDGVMAEFFDAGHVVFNRVDRERPLDTADAVHEARQDGVDIVLAVEVKIVRIDSAYRVESMVYRAVDVSSGDVYLEDGLDDDVLARGSAESREEAAQRAGVEIGALVIETL